MVDNFESSHSTNASPRPNLLQTDSKMRFEETGLNNHTDDENEIKFETDMSVLSHGP